MEIIRKFCNNKDLRIDKISAEFLKQKRVTAVEYIYKLISAVGIYERVPREWGKGDFISNFQEGDSQNCESYRAIALLPMAYKILSIAINRNLMAWVEKIVGEYCVVFGQGGESYSEFYSVFYSESYFLTVIAAVERGSAPSVYRF